MVTRRQILRAFNGFALSSAINPLLGRHTFGEAAMRVHVGVQTNAWVIDPNNFESLLAVLRQIKEIGYAGFETGFFNLVGQFASPAEAKQRLAATDLTFFGIHIAAFDKDDPQTNLPPPSLYQQVARGGAALGARHLILSGGPSTTFDGLKRKVDALNTAGAFSKQVGIPLAYHNHWWEFQSKIGEIEALYSQTNPAEVSFVLDAGHAYRGGADVPRFLRRHADRLVGLHLRDYKNGQQVPLGEGSFPLKEVALTVKELHWNGWVLNEEEREDGWKNGLQVIEPAYRSLRGAFSS